MKYSFHEPFAYCRWRKTLLIMRLTAILLVAFAFNAAARGTAQTVTLSVSNMPLEKVCKEIEKQTGYYFVYAKNFNKDNHLVSLKISGASIEETLRRVFEGLPFTYQVIDKVVVVNTVNKVNKASDQIVSPEPGTSVKARGVVLNETGQPLSGATVMIKASGKTTLTNARGEFSFSQEVPANSVIVVSFIGYTAQEIRIGDGSSVRIFLGLAMNILDATVVKGYYNTTNRLNTGNVTTVKGEDIAKQPVSDPLLALEGRVPGLYISQTSGVPGAYSTVRLRGMNSIPAPGDKPVTVNDPLYLVDGVPFSSATLSSRYIKGGAVVAGLNDYGLDPGQGMSPFNSLNPNDIESIEVLKDADATAIYGSRGANGVIIITTKRGKAGNTKFDLNLYTGGAKVTRRANLLNTKQYLAMRHEGEKNDGFLPFPFDYDINGVWDSTRYIDWQKVLIGNPARFTNAEANITGGNANTQFLIGGGYSKQGTLFPGDYADQKASLHISVSNASNDQRFHTQLTVNFVNNSNNLPSLDLTGIITLAPDAPALYDAKGNLNWQVKDGTATWLNPLANTRTQARAVTNNMVGNLLLSYQILTGLELKANLGYNQIHMDQTVLTPATAATPPYDRDLFSRSNGFATTDQKSWIIEPQANYQRQIGQGKLDVLMGTSFQENTGNSITQLARGFVDDALISNPQAASILQLQGKDYSLYRYNALFGRINFNWAEKYLLNVTARRDGSSRFGPGKQFGNFGAIGAGWIFSKEQFLQSVPTLSFGKLRVSYGSTGNDQIADYQYLSSYVPYAPTYSGVAGLVPARLPNRYYGWERVKKLELGLELGFIKDRIILSMSYYRNRTDNQLVGYSLPAITGFGSVQANLPALIQNKGIEFTLNTINLRTAKFTWKSALNLSVPENKLLKYPDIQNSTYKYSYAVGKSLFSRYLYDYRGVDPQTGIYTYASQKGNGVPSNPEDIIISRPITQQFYGGIQNSLSYKGFQLDILVQFVKQLGYNILYAFSGKPPGTFNVNQPEIVLSRWQKPGDITNIQKFSQIDPAYTAYQQLFFPSNAVITDASFVRLKNLAVSYRFPDNWQKQMHLQDARIYLQCQNVVTVTNYLGMDPETGGLSLPALRMITAGFQVKF